MKALGVVQQPEVLRTVEERRVEANRILVRSRKDELGQFLTPGKVADFMAALFSPPSFPVHLLDPGAGVGSLSAAFLARWGGDRTRVCAYEVDAVLSKFLEQTLTGLDAKIERRDFIEDAVYQITMGGRVATYTHAILNPPYKKLNSASLHRSLLRAVGLETVNLYTAFVGLSLELLSHGGELVAIIPRSFCNGLYYKPFREWILAKASIDHIHLFHSRTSTFRDDEVLQENVIIKLVRGRRQGAVTITTASDASFFDLKAHSYSFDDIVRNGDPQRFIHIPADPKQRDLGSIVLASSNLPDIGLEVSTGPVVDFRLKEFLRKDFEAGTVPLLYPTHFVSGTVKWPRASKKPNAIVSNRETRKWMFPSGSYTVVKRFTSKEEPRRIVAHVVTSDMFPADEIAFENHLNIFHFKKRGIDRDIAYGLALFLNSTCVDEYFRRFSGHTQVNATDLRLLRYPERSVLSRLGRWAQSQPHLTQELIDSKIEDYGSRE